MRVLCLLVLAGILTLEQVACFVPSAILPASVTTRKSSTLALRLKACEPLPRRDVLLLAPATLAFLSTVSPNSAKAEGAPAAAENPAEWVIHDGAFKDSEFSDFSSTPSGLKYKDVIVGTGASPTAADTVRVHYAGYLTSGQLFDSSYRPPLFPFSLFLQSGPPMAFKLSGGLIPGFSEAVLGMKVGGKRIVYIKPELGYGPVGVKGVIPPDSPLVFYLELKSIGSGISL